MWNVVCTICTFVCLLLAVIYAVKAGTKKQAELERLLEQAEERKNANKIIDNVRNMAADDVYDRLSDINRD